MLRTRTFVIRAFVLLALARAAGAQPAPTVVISPVPKLQFFDNNGKPMSGGCVATYAGGTTTTLATYTDATGTVANQNPVVLDASGRASIWIKVPAIKFVVKQKNGPTCSLTSGTILYTTDNVQDAGLRLRQDLATPGANVPDQGLQLRTDLAGPGGAGLVGFSPPGGTVTVPVSTVLRAGVVYPQSFGAKCDGTTDDAAAFRAAVAAAIAGDTIAIYSEGGAGCVVSSNVSIGKALTLSSAGPAGGAGIPAQIKVGADNITAFTVSNTGGVTFDGFSVSANAHVGATAVAMTGSNHVVMKNMTISGNFLEAVDCTNTYFVNFDNIHVFGAQAGLNLHNQCNVVTVDQGSAFLMNQPTVASAISASNTLNTTIIGSDFECSSVINALNANGVLIHGNHFETDVLHGCASMAGAAMINLGAPFAQAPVFGASIEGNEIGSADWGVNFADCLGCESSGNTFQTLVRAHIVTVNPSAAQPVSGCSVAAVMVCTSASVPVTGQSVSLQGFTNTGGNDWTGANRNWVATNLSSTTFSVPFNSSALVTFSGQTPTVAIYAQTNIHIGANDYSGNPDTFILAYSDVYADTTASNSTQTIINPFRFSFAMPIPQPSHVPPGYGSLYWRTADQTNATQGSFRGRWNTNGTAGNTVPITDAECLTTGPADACKIDGNLMVLPTGSTPTVPATNKPAAMTFRTGGGDVYIGEDDASGSQIGVPNAGFIVMNSLQPMVIAGPALGHGGTVMCWKADGKSIGYATVTEITAGTCH